MLIGHYGASLLARHSEPKLRVSAIFVAAQWVDIVWCVLVIAGVERLRILPGVTATNDLDLYFMPYSHSLVAAVVWGAVALAVCRYVFGARWRTAAWLAVIVSGHWVLDLVVHRPDLAVIHESAKVGFGLWNYPVVAFLLETSLLGWGVVLYLQQTEAASVIGQYGMGVLGFAMVAIQAFVFFGPGHMTAMETVGWALFGYGAFAGIAWLLESQRREGQGQRRRHLPWIA